MICNGSSVGRAAALGLAASLLLALLSSGAALALDPSKRITQYKHRVWRQEDGLPHNAVLDIAQTRNGYLWFATQDWLARFDGVRFDVFDSTSKVNSAGEVSRIYEDQGVLWMGIKDGGLLRSKMNKLGAYITSDGQSSNAVTAIHRCANGELWIGTQDGGVTTIKSGEYHVYSTLEGLSNDYVTAISEAQDGSVWIGTRAGLTRFKDGRFSKYTVKYDG